MTRRGCAGIALLAFLCLPAAASAAEPAAVAVAPPAPDAAQDPRVTVPAGTELVFEMRQDITSKTAQRGDRFPLRLAQDLRVDSHLLVPAGAPAVGEVVHADRARAGGQAGELILAARYLEWDGRQLPLSAFRAGVGKNRSNTALGVSIAAGLAGFLVRGGQTEMPAGTLITAKLREATELPIVPEPAVPATTITTQSTDNTTGEHPQ